MMGRLRALAGISVFWVGLSVVGDAFIAVVVVQAVAAAAPPSLTATALGLITFAGIAAGMVVQPIAGAVSDALRPTWGRRGQLVVGAFLVLLALAVFGAASTLLAVAVAFVLVQVAVAIAQAAQQGFIPDVVEQRWRGRAAGAKGLADLGGAFIGFALLAAVAGAGQAAGVTAVAAVVGVTAFAAVILVREQRSGAPDRAPRRSVREAVAQAFHVDVAARGPFIRVLASRFIFLLATFIVGRYLLLIVAERLGMPASEAGAAAATLFATLTLISALASIPAGWIADRDSRRRVMVAGALLSGAGALTFFGSREWLVVLAAGGVMAVGSAAFTTASWAWTTDLVDDGAAGRQMGVANFATAGAAAVAGLLGLAVDASRSYLLPGLGFGVALLPATLLFVVAALVAGSTPPQRASMAPPDPTVLRPRPATRPHPLSSAEVPEQ